MTTRYKIVVDQRSCHGGTFDWTAYLPADDAPGPWTPAVEHVALCETGYHLTTDPMRWAKVGMQVYEAEGRGRADEDGDKTAYASVRLLRPAPGAIPAYWAKVEAFIASIASVPWFRPQGEPDPAWRLFDTWGAAWGAARDAAWVAAGDAVRDAAWGAAWDAAGDAAGAAMAGVAAWNAARDAAWDAAWAAMAGVAAWDAARDAMLLAAILTCDGLPLDQRHVNHARARWAVWQAGYGLMGDVDGLLYVYRTIT